MASFLYFGSSQASLVQTLANPTPLKDSDDRTLTVPAEVVSGLPVELLQKIRGILDCERISVDGRVAFLRRIVTDYTSNRERFFGQMSVLDFIRDQTLGRLCKSHVEETHNFIRTSADGSCGFEALAMPFKEKGWNVGNLRVNIAKFTRNNLAKLKTRDEMKGGFADIPEVKTDSKLDDVKIEAYIKKLENPRTVSDGWLSVREIAIFVHCMHKKDINCRVLIHSHIYYDDELSTYVPQVYDENLLGNPYAGDKEVIDINLYYDGRGHYDFLDPSKQKEQKNEGMIVEAVSLKNASDDETPVIDTIDTNDDVDPTQD
jgi:hypothetical protein